LRFDFPGLGPSTTHEALEIAHPVGTVPLRLTEGQTGGDLAAHRISRSEDRTLISYAEWIKITGENHASQIATHQKAGQQPGALMQHRASWK
jgi:hypothetical protein